MKTLKALRCLNVILFAATCVCLFLSAAVPGFEIQLNPDNGMPTNAMGAVYWPICMGFVCSVFPLWTD